MRQTDVAIVGGGLAGSVAAAMLGRQGIDAIVVDPHEQYPADFRCEKLDPSQLELLRSTGLADAILPHLTIGQEVWVARFGRLLRKRRFSQANFSYDTLVNAFRGQIPDTVQRIRGKATEIETGEDRQRVVLSDGTEISARLVVLATGLNNNVRKQLGITRREISPRHSISIGFDMVPRDRFDFTSLTYAPERVADQAAYITLFPIGGRMRANLFVYRDLNDPWLREMQRSPEAGLKALMPRLATVIGDFAVEGEVRVRPVDLYVAEGVQQPGVVLVGDSYCTSCPAAGTGVNKVLNDVVQLCGHHLPAWLATPGMGAEKIAQFYDDPVKRVCDEDSRAKALFLRTLSTAPGIRWRARRLARGAAHLALGKIEAIEALLLSGPDGEGKPHKGTAAPSTEALRMMAREGTEAADAAHAAREAATTTRLTG